MWTMLQRHDMHNVWTTICERHNARDTVTTRNTAAARAALSATGRAAGICVRLVREAWYKRQTAAGVIANSRSCATIAGPQNTRSRPDISIPVG